MITIAISGIMSVVWSQGYPIASYYTENMPLSLAPLYICIILVGVALYSLPPLIIIYVHGRGQ